METIASIVEAPIMEQDVFSVQRRERYTNTGTESPKRTEKCIVYGAERYWTNQGERDACSLQMESISFENLEKGSFFIYGY